MVDASVAVKWFLPEVHDEAARRLLKNDHFVANQRLQIPDFFFAEVSNILWKKIRRQELSLEQGQTLLQ
ncbi:MAG: type II toxin-antitoxin system VapC family toxin, partial [Armatimonadota bacterium]|nr:type II toxin-antitoxin system VapC family toxin [Armatimonadota bacterium]